MKKSSEVDDHDQLSIRKDIARTQKIVDRLLSGVLVFSGVSASPGDTSFAFSHVHRARAT